MLKAYLNLAVTRMIRNKVFAAVNILGLAVALSAFFFIIAYVSYETSFDDFHTNGTSIYRVALEQYEGETLINKSAKTYPGIYNFLNRDIPEVESATRFMKIPANTGFLFGYDQKIFNEPGGTITADTNFFKVFPSLLVRGDINTALRNPGSIIISETVAKTVFGDIDPIGRTLDRLDEKGQSPFTVTGILKDIPENSHFHAKFITKLEEIWPEIIEEPWNPILIYTYALLPKDVDQLTVTVKMNRLLEEAAKTSPKIKGSRVFLQPNNEIHLTSQLKDEFEANGNRNLVFVMLVVGTVIMITAWINYINIETSRFSRRNREIGVRRIIGSRKVDLALQFVIEFACVTGLAVVLAATFIITLRPVLSRVSEIPFHQFQIQSTRLWWTGLSILVLGTICTGVYPGLFLIKLNPAKAIKGSFIQKGFLKKPLLVVQFSASLMLVSFLLVINSQLDQMRTTERKLDIDKIIAIRNPVAYMNQEVVDKYNSFKLLEDKLLQLPSVDMVTTSSAVPGTEVGFTYVDLIKKTLNEPYDPTRYKTVFVGDNFISLYGIKLLAGRHFESANDAAWKDPWERADWSKLILNEKAIKTLGFKSAQEAVNQVVKFKAFDEFEDYEIIGVVDDYHHEAARKQILPMIFKVNFNSFQQVFYSVRLAPGTETQQAISDIEKTWKSIFPDRPLDYFFIDDHYDQQFKSERKFSAIFGIFSSIALFLACLGILGMAYFEATARVKEISVRKILGASAINLLKLLSRDQMKCTILACILSFPFVWYGAELWLSTYPVRIQLSPFIIILPVVVLTAIIGSVSVVQTVRAMAENPVDHLRNE